ncbi:hypothetical protein BDY21DRAFT_366038 [Lineolata rhizophorae]|uniref:Uncharacterized protein n=1 Tax=Lineolata rhizophorae TaxID=578093 RepID=A0A6A6NSD3_9PEZI|nr:hypothetical protein BDY21DRAFT_366038 [Lineolata rhizophorae]
MAQEPQPPYSELDTVGRTRNWSNTAGRSDRRLRRASLRPFSAIPGDGIPGGGEFGPRTSRRTLTLRSLRLVILHLQLVALGHDSKQKCPKLGSPKKSCGHS